jgi:hypothetical protein
MKNIIILLALIPALLIGQIPGDPDASGVVDPGPPWVTGSNSGDGEIIQQLEYIQGVLDSIKSVFNYEDSTISALRYLDWDLEDGWSQQEGRTGWDDDDKTLGTGLDRGSVLQHGQENLIRAVNQTGVTITNGQLVYVSGGIGSRAIIALADKRNAATAFTTIGMATQDIPDNTTGHVVTFGLGRDIDTEDFPDGLYTDVRPIAPDITVVVGIVFRSHATEGVIGVRIIPVFRLAWLSDVRAQGSQTHWDILYWNNDSSRWELNDGVLVVDSVVTRVLDYEPPHGALAFADSTATIDLTQNEWLKVTNGNNDLYTVVDNDGITMDGDSITIVTPGDYMLWVGLSFDGNVQDVYHCAIYKNGAVTPFEMHRKTANNDTGNMSMSVLLDNLVIGDGLSLYIRNTGNNNDPVFISSQITILMIHPR